MTEQKPPQFSEELIEKLTTTTPIELMPEIEQQRLHDAVQANHDARLETERIIHTLYLD